MDRTVTFKQEEISGHESQTRLDTKTDTLTVSCNVTDFDFKHLFMRQMSFKTGRSYHATTRKQTLEIMCYSYSNL
jgi:hypothetical protein